MNIVYFILRHYYNEMGKRFNQVNVPQITGQTMNPLRTTPTMTHATPVREQKGAIAAEITTAPIFPI